MFDMYCVATKCHKNNAEIFKIYLKIFLKYILFYMHLLSIRVLINLVAFKVLL